MTIKAHLFAATALLSLLAFTHSVQAGKLFPPYGLSDPTSNCPSGKVLTWLGSQGAVECVDPTPGVNFACPTGQVLSAIGVDRQLTCVTPGGGSGWVSVPKGYSESNYYVPCDPSNANPACSGVAADNRIPFEAWCQKKGYTTYAGACKEPEGRITWNGEYGGFQGVGVSNSYAYGSATSWHWSCMYGNGAFAMDSEAQILCLK